MLRRTSQCWWNKIVDKGLYSEIKNLIIRWNIDGTKTAGYLTRQIVGLLIGYKINSEKHVVPSELASHCENKVTRPLTFDELVLYQHFQNKNNITYNVLWLCEAAAT